MLRVADFLTTAMSRSKKYSKTPTVRKTRFAKSRGFRLPFIKIKLGRRSLLIFNYLITFTLYATLLSAFAMFVLVTYYSRELPNPNRLVERSAELSTKFFDRNGASIYEVYGEKNRSLVTLDQVSPNAISAALAAEDSTFYQHSGYSLLGIARALRNMIEGGGLQSGSTLTQQVVKNTLLTQERTVSRKIKEFILSLQLENAYTKDQILQLYFNETPYGGQSYGILTASKAYFNKFPSELNIAEAAYLAGLPQRPSYYSYYGSNPEAGLERKNYVLYLMNQRGWVDRDGQRHFLSNVDYETAKNEQLHFQASFAPFKAPHFVLYVKQILADKYGEDAVQQGGLQVTTTLDSKLQDDAETIVLDEVSKAKYLNVGNGSLVAIDPKTGQILAMVGSKGYFLKSEPEGCTSGITGPGSCTFEPNLNVTLARRQPGSSIKPITYATLLSKGYTASFPFLDAPTTFPGAAPDQPYDPVNYDGKFHGVIPLRNALGNSLNIPAVKALKLASINSMIDTAQNMGITTLGDRSRFGLALTLGGGETKLLEMTDAFAVFAAKGIYREPVAILQVKDSKGNILYDWRDSGGTRALGEDVSFLISDILSDDGARSMEFGAGSLLNIMGHQVAVKTGTTDDKRDNYAMGFTPSITVGVWVGNNNNDRMNPILSSGITGATPIWHRFMVDYLKDKPNEKFEAPQNVKKVTIDKLTGMLPFDENPTRPEWFVQGSEPTAKSSWYKKLEICKPDGKIANQDCKDANQTKVKTYIKITAEIPEWQNAVDKWVAENFKGDDQYFPPQTVSHLKFDSDGKVTNDSSVYVDVASLKDGDHVPLQFRFSVEVSAANDIKKVRIYLDGNQVTSDSSVPFGYNFTFSQSDAGKHEFKAEAEDKEGNTGSTTINLNVGI